MGAISVDLRAAGFVRSVEASLDRDICMGTRTFSMGGVVGRGLAGVPAVEGAMEGVPVDGGVVSILISGDVPALIGCSIGKLLSSFMLLSTVIARQTVIWADVTDESVVAVVGLQLSAA